MNGFLSRMIPDGKVRGNSSSSSRTDSDERIKSVERIIVALCNSNMIEDRRAAAKALRSMARHYKLEIGSVAIPSLFNALSQDPEDVELVRAVLGTLVAICSGQNSVEADEVALNDQFCRMILQREGSVEQLVEFLPQSNRIEPFIMSSCDYELIMLFYVLAFSIEEFGVVVLKRCPDFIGRLVAKIDNLNVSEVVMIELLNLFCVLTGRSTQVQRLVVFDGGFEKLFARAKSSLKSENCVVSMQIIHNLITSNPSNQRYLCQTFSLLAEIANLLKILSAEEVSDWESVKICLDIIFDLLNPEAPQFSSIQETLLRTGMFDILVELSIAKDQIARMASRNEAMSEPASICTLCETRRIWKCLGARETVNIRAMNVLTKLMIGALHTKTRFTRATVGLGDLKTPAILGLINHILEDDLGPIQQAAESLLCEILRDNVDGQIAIASTFRAPDNDQSAGSTIISHIFAPISSIQAVNDYLLKGAAAIFSMVLHRNEECKAIALRHRINYEDSEDTVTLLTALFLRLRALDNVSCGDKIAVSLLTVLSVWLQKSQQTVREVLMESPYIQYLLELFSEHSDHDHRVQGMAAFCVSLCILYYPVSKNDVGSLSGDFSNFSFDKDSLTKVVANRIGSDVFAARLHHLQTDLQTLGFDIATEERYLFNLKRFTNRIFTLIFQQEYPLAMFVVTGRHVRIESKAIEATDQEENQVNTVPKVLNCVEKCKSDDKDESMEGSVHTTDVRRREADFKIGDGSVDEAMAIFGSRVLQTARFEVESLRGQLHEMVMSQREKDSLIESLTTGAGSRVVMEAYAKGEMDRLQKLSDAYAAQMIAIERDHEELLVLLASYDGELKQLRQRLEQRDNYQTETGADMNYLRNSVTLIPSSTYVEATKIQDGVTSDARGILQNLPIGSLYISNSPNSVEGAGGLLSKIVPSSAPSKTMTDV